MQYLYKEGGDLVSWIDRTMRRSLKATDRRCADLMKDNLPCRVVVFNERPVDVVLPTFVQLDVTATEPSVPPIPQRQRHNKATVETGAVIHVPLFIRVGDTDRDRYAHARVRRPRQNLRALMPTLGRVLARDGQIAVVRCERVRPAGGHPSPERVVTTILVDVDTPALVRVISRRRAIPAPGSEVMRLPRARLELLHARARAARAARTFFEARGFLEVETPLLVPARGSSCTSTRSRRRRLADHVARVPDEAPARGGHERIFQIAVLPRRGAGRHNPEFTMLEWYRANARVDAIMATPSSWSRASCGGSVRDRRTAPSIPPPCPRITVCEAMASTRASRSAATRTAASRPRTHAARRPRTWRTCSSQRSSTPSSPRSPRWTRVFLEDWPAPLAALARQKRRSARGGALRGVRRRRRAGNGFGELTDRRRAARAVRARSRSAASRKAGVSDRREAPGGARARACRRRWQRARLRPPRGARHRGDVDPDVLAFAADELEAQATTRRRRESARPMTRTIVAALPPPAA